MINVFTSLPKSYMNEAMKAHAGHDREIRQKGQDNLQQAAIKVGVRRFILQSAAFWYAPGHGLATEKTPFAFEASPAIASGCQFLANLEQNFMPEKALETVFMRF